MDEVGKAKKVENPASPTTGSNAGGTVIDSSQKTLTYGISNGAEAGTLKLQKAGEGDKIFYRLDSSFGKVQMVGTLLATKLEEDLSKVVASYEIAKSETDKTKIGTLYVISVVHEKFSLKGRF